MDSSHRGDVASVGDVDHPDIPLSDTQFQQLMAAVNAFKSVSGTSKLHGKIDLCQWIIDTGALNHMSSNLNLFCELYDIPSEPVGLPNGKRTTATKEGRVKLSEHVTLDNVFYMFPR